MAKISVASALAVAPDLTFAAVTGDSEALGKIDKLVKESGGVLNPIVQKPREEWVAGDKANLIASGEGFLQNIELILAKPWQLSVPTVENMNLGGLPNLKTASKYLVLYADAVDEGGNPEYAIRALLAARNLSNRLYENANSLLSQLVANAIDASAERSTRQLVVRGSMSASELEKLQRNSLQLDPARSGLANALRGEWTHFFVPMVATVDFPVKGEDMTLVFGYEDEQLNAWAAGNKLPLDRIRTVEIFAPFIRTALEEIQGAATTPVKSQAKLSEILRGIPEDESQLPDWVANTENSIGLLMGQGSLGIWESALVAAVKCEVSRGLSEVVVAAQRGLAEAGSLPKDMAELRKYGLPAHVKDAYSGKDFLYDPVRGIAWSVGPDGKDDGGKDQPERWVDDAKDRVVRVK